MHKNPGRSGGWFVLYTAAAAAVDKPGRVTLRILQIETLRASHYRYITLRHALQPYSSMPRLLTAYSAALDRQQARVYNK